MKWTNISSSSNINIDRNKDNNNNININSYINSRNESDDYKKSITSSQSVEQKSLSSIPHSSRSSTISTYSLNRVQKSRKTKTMLDILLSSGSFDKEFQNLIFLLSPTLSKHLLQLVLKNYGDDKKIKYFDNMAKIYGTSSKSKGKL